MSTSQIKSEFLNNPLGDNQKEVLRLEEKYINLIAYGYNTPSAIAEHEAKGKNKAIQLRFVNAKYNTIADSSVTVNQSDLESYLSDNHSKFAQKEDAPAVKMIK